MGILDTFKRKKTTDTKPAGKKPAKARVKAAAKPKAAKVVDTNESKELVMTNILIKPAYTEKSFKLQSENKYVFYVTLDANKHQVRMAVKETYGTEPEAVHMIRIKPQAMYRWGRVTGSRKGIKKAIVTMPVGTSLPVTK